MDIFLNTPDDDLDDTQPIPPELVDPDPVYVGGYDLRHDNRVVYLRHPTERMYLKVTGRTAATLRKFGYVEISRAEYEADA